ncbi:hypothetical protein BDY24DRAFT_381316 [Mrakia frigida]|uniref:phosphoinositide 5-phosphatase INP54 n=1 Tax=Mrakia frigida TaxID=29902 RepID=UPI003FCC0C00
MPKPLNVFLTTYNANLRARTATIKDLTEWLTSGVKDFSDKKGSSSPPDLVVIGMQEVAELHLALAGATSSVYSLLTLQITSILSAHAKSLSPTSVKESYTLLGLTYHTNVALFVFALDRTLPVSQKARGEKGMVLGSMVKRSIGLGLVGGLMGNKAAVGGRIWIERGAGESPVVESFTFICAHFAPHAQNIADRIANYDRLTSRLLFPLHPPSNQTPITTQINASSHLFLLGDLNYRLGTTPAPGGAYLPAPKDLRDLIVAGVSIEKEGQLGWESLKKWDTLKMIQTQGRSLGGFEEGDIAGFPPTYKFEIGKAGVYRFVPSLLLSLPLPLLSLSGVGFQADHLSSFLVTTTAPNELPPTPTESSSPPPRLQPRLLPSSPTKPSQPSPSPTTLPFYFLFSSTLLTPPSTRTLSSTSNSRLERPTTRFNSRRSSVRSSIRELGSDGGSW